MCNDTFYIEYSNAQCSISYGCAIAILDIMMMILSRPYRQSLFKSWFLCHSLSITKRQPGIITCAMYVYNSYTISIYYVAQMLAYKNQKCIIMLINCKTIAQDGEMQAIVNAEARGSTIIRLEPMEAKLHMCNPFISSSSSSSSSFLIRTFSQ